MMLQPQIAGCLDDSRLLQLATAAAGTPWICTVSFASSPDFILYWVSRHDTRHSKELAQNPQVAGAVVPPRNPDDPSRGLQLAGRAHEVTDQSAVAEGLQVMQKRFGMSDERVEQMTNEIVERHADYGLYRFQPDTIVLLDKANFTESPWRVWTRQPARAHR